MDWSLLGCGRFGHITYAPDEPEVAAQLSATTATAEPAWCCLRCATFVPGPAQLSGPAHDAPRVRRGLEIRSLFILRFFAVERFLRAILFLGLAVLLWRFKHSQHSVEEAWDREQPILRTLFRQLGFNIDHSKLVGLIQHALTLSTGALTLLAIGLAAYAAIEVVECVGLWLARRWGEYFAMVATSAGLPIEIYDLSRKVTVTALIFLAVNLALVIYLVVTKRLFGARGGKHAYEARLRSDSIMETAITAAEATQAVTNPSAAQPTPTVTNPSAAQPTPAVTNPSAAHATPTVTNPSAAQPTPTVTNPSAAGATPTDPAPTPIAPTAAPSAHATPSATAAFSASTGATATPPAPAPPAATAATAATPVTSAPPATPAPSAALPSDYDGEVVPDSTSPQPVGRHRAPSTPPATDSSS